MGALVEALSNQPPLPPMRRRGALLCQGLDAAAAALDRRDHPEQVAAARPEVAFRDFIPDAWRVVEPATAFKPNWHIDAIAEHLEAVTAGDIRRLLVNMPPRHAKPVWEEEFVVEQTRGRIRLADVRVGDAVLTHRGRYRRVLAVHDQGELPLVRVTTHAGRAVRTAPDHPFLTPRGWVQAQHLGPHDVVASVHPAEPTGTATVTPEEARLLGYLVGDGTCISSQVGVTNEDPAVIADVEHCAAALGFHTRRRVKAGCRSVFVVIKASATRWTTRRQTSPLRAWLERHGLRGATSYTKRVPPALLAATPGLIAEFLGAYWSCDGHIASRGGSRTDCCIGADTVSEGLARDVQHLLLRLGIAARVRRKQAKLQSKRQGAIYTSWQAVITSLDHGSKFCACVPIRHAKKAGAARYVRSGFDRVLNEDPVVSVDADGTGRCRCLTVDEDESFTAGDLAVHNSLLIAVFWPTWVWTFRPSLRWLFASYAQSLSTRDSLKCRRIIESPWYRERWGKVFTLTSDQNQKTRFENDRTGYRLATSVDGSATGEGGDCLVTDDPHNARRAESDADREAKLSWFDQVWSTRLNDQKTGAMVTVMQRVHHRDISGHILALGGWVHLCLPTEFEAKRRCVTVPVGDREEPWDDPRTEEGELLFPERFGDKEVAEAKKGGSYFYAGQHQQRPSPRQGGIWQRDWWRRYHTPKCGHVAEGDRQLPQRFDAEWQSWDMAFKDLTSSDYVVGQAWGSVGADAYLRHQVRRQMSFTKTCAAVERMSGDYPGTDAKLVEDKANGTAVIDTLRSKIPGLIAVEPDGGKIARAIAASPTIEAGNVWIPCDESADWVGEFVEECTSFPNAAHDDQVDATSQGIRRHQRAPVVAAPAIVESTSYWRS